MIFQPADSWIKGCAFEYFFDHWKQDSATKEAVLWRMKNDLDNTEDLDHFYKTGFHTDKQGVYRDTVWVHSAEETWGQPLFVDFQVLLRL